MIDQFACRATLVVLLTAGFSLAQPMRVGTYDSRAIAVAYAHSNFMHEHLRALAAERDEAKKEGDEKRVHEIEARGGAEQQRLHLQGFSTGSVIDLMKKIDAELPGVAKAAGVSLIVSKWEVMYRDPAVEYVDVTIPLVKKFGADGQVLKIVEELMKQDPIPADKVPTEAGS